MCSMWLTAVKPAALQLAPRVELGQVAVEQLAGSGRDVDLTAVLLGPYCTQMLADEGARVLKIEDPAKGDETRLWGPPFAGDTSTSTLR